MKDEEVQQWDLDITRVSKSVSRDFPDTEWEDLHQDLWEHVLSEEKVQRAVGKRWVRSYLSKVARAMSWDKRKEYLQWTSQYSYRTSDVRQLLNTDVTDPGTWEQGWTPEDARGKGSRMIMAIDINWAVGKLPENYRRAIADKYEGGIDPESGTKERRTLNRAITRIADVLNCYRGRPSMERNPGPGARRAITNANARYLVDESWGE